MEGLVGDGIILQEAITLAQSNASHAVAGALAGNYAQASIDTLNAAIAVAQGITSALAQSVVDAATATLNGAIAVFQGSRALATSQVMLAPSTTLTASSSQAVITSGDTATSTITVSDATVSASLDVSALVQSGSVVLPGAIAANVSLPVGTVSVTMPASTTITATGSWNGTINLPQVVAVSSVTPTPTAGNTATVATAIEVGANDVALTFDRAVRILMPGQAGKIAGYARAGIFSHITNVCAADTQASGDALGAGSECAMNVGSDMVIWTKHFTTFVAYTETAIPAPAVGASGGGGGGMIMGLFGTVTTPPLADAEVPDMANVLTATSTAEVTMSPETQSQLQASRNKTSSVPLLAGATSTPSFVHFLAIGATGDEVVSLQKLLAKDGFYDGGITGKVGALTYASVRKYQFAHHLALTGYTDAPTRDALNREMLAANVSAVAATPPAAISTIFTRTLVIGSVGDDVTALQKLLAQGGYYTGPITGKVGALTYEAVRAYQQAQHLIPTGYLGPQTRDLLNREAVR